MGKGYSDKCNFKKENFSSDCELSEEIKNRVEEYEEKLSDVKVEVTKRMKKLLKKLYKNNFIRLKKEKLKKNLKSLEMKILDFLIKENIIKEIYDTSRDRRREDFLEIELKYHSSFEEIFEGQKSVNKILLDIVDKFILTMPNVK